MFPWLIMKGGESFTVFAPKKRHLSSASRSNGASPHHRTHQRKLILVEMKRKSEDNHSRRKLKKNVSVEIFIQKNFSEIEAASITSTLAVANKVGKLFQFRWRFVSDTPGLVEGEGGFLARSEPSVFDHNLPDLLIVVGGHNASPNGWMARKRAMQRIGRTTVLLSGSATAYIRATHSCERDFTTHWRDVLILSEEGFYPSLSTRYVESSDGVITSAGSNYTSELVISILASYLSRKELAEIASQLMIRTVRNRTAEQPKGVSFIKNAFCPTVSQAIRLMEQNISEPLSIKEISLQLKASIRQIERSFNAQLNMSPSRFYKRLRTQNAHLLLTETEIPLIEVALSAGFSSVSGLSNAVRTEYGVTPTQARLGSRLR